MIGRAFARRSPTVSILAALWLVIVIGFLLLRPGAFAVSTLTTVLQFSTLLALVSLGQSLVVLCGGAGIDLSVGRHGVPVCGARDAGAQGRDARPSSCPQPA